MKEHQLITIPFHEDKVYMIEIDGEPYIPVRPIVENLGLNWKSQFRKLMADPERWGVVIKTIPSPGGPQETVCMPLRKFPAYLYGIEPRKTREALRPKLKVYQIECDKALWDYWTKGHAENPRLADRGDAPQRAIELVLTILETLQASYTNYPQLSEFLYLRTLGLTQEKAGRACNIELNNVQIIERRLKESHVTLPNIHAGDKKRQIRETMKRLLLPAVQAEMNLEVRP